MYLYPLVQFAYLTHCVLSDSTRIHPALQLGLTNEVFKRIYIRSVTASNSFDAYHPSGASLWAKIKDSGFVRAVVIGELGPGSLVMVPSGCNFFFGYQVVNSSAESIIDRLDKLLDQESLVGYDFY